MGLFTFIGATTENPSFEVNSALLSRARCMCSSRSAEAELRQLLDRAGTCSRAPPTDAAAQRLIGYADGDARRLLNTLENRSPGRRRRRGGDRRGPARAHARRTLRRLRQGRRRFYDTISALHKSVRGGSDPTRRCTGSCACSTAASTRATPRGAWCAWRARDIGNADPRAAPGARRAETYERLGLARGKLALAQAWSYLAVAPKSNAVYAAYNAARASSRTTARGRCRCTCATRRRA